MQMSVPACRQYGEYKKEVYEFHYYSFDAKLACFY